MTTTNNTNENKPTLSTFKHSAYNAVFALIKLGKPVLLWGEAGTGKNVMVEQIAAELGIPFGFTNAILETYGLKGFKNATGDYESTPFYNIWKNGGVFFLDEFDASDPEAVIWLNAALANGYAEFPHEDEPVYAHKDFVFVAGANSNGYNHNPKYKRRTLDAATLNRFAMWEVKWDPALEQLIYEDFIKKASKRTNSQYIQSRLTLAYNQFKKTREIQKDYDDELLLSTRTLSNIFSAILDTDLEMEDIWEAFIYQGRPGIAKQYSKELNLVTVNVVKDANGDFVGATESVWNRTVPVELGLIDMINADKTKVNDPNWTPEYEDLNEYFSAKWGIEIKAGLTSIKYKEILQLITGPLGLMFEMHNGSTSSDGVVQLQISSKGKYSAQIKTGKNVEQDIKAGTAKLISWDPTRQQGIVLNAEQMETEDHRLYGNVVASAEVAEMQAEVAEEATTPEEKPY